MCHVIYVFVGSSSPTPSPPHHLRAAPKKPILNRVTNLINTTNAGKEGECKKDFMKIKLHSYDNLPLGRILKLRMLTIAVRSVFEEDGKYYPQMFLDEYLLHEFLDEL